jgi:hypothetical protein
MNSINMCPPLPWAASPLCAQQEQIRFLQRNSLPLSTYHYEMLNRDSLYMCNDRFDPFANRDCSTTHH